MATVVSNLGIAASDYALHRLPHLGDSVLQVPLPDEVRGLREEPCWQMQSGRSAKTLIKYPDLRIVLVTMRARTHMRRHRTNARLALVALSGHIRLHLPHATVKLPAGELLALERNMPHDLEAIPQSTFLLIISWPGSTGCLNGRDPEDRTIDGNDLHQVREKMLDKTIADSFPASDPGEWADLFEQNGMEVTWSVAAPMHLLEPERLLRDEGLWGGLRIAVNVATKPLLQQRIIAMRRLFRRYQPWLCAISLVGQVVDRQKQSPGLASVVAIDACSNWNKIEQLF